VLTVQENLFKPASLVHASIGVPPTLGIDNADGYYDTLHKFFLAKKKATAEMASTSSDTAAFQSVGGYLLGRPGL